MSRSVETRQRRYFFNQKSPKAADISQRLISLAPENLVKWVTQIPDIVTGEIINSEFQWISRESDVLRHQSRIWRIYRT